MRIIFATQHLADGGAEREIVTFANTLARMGEDVCIVYIKDWKIDYAVDSRVQTCYVPCRSKVKIPKIRGLCNTVMFLRQMKKLSGDVIIAENFALDCNWWFWISSLFFGGKMVYAVINNMEKKCLGKKMQKQYEKICRMADAIWIQTHEQVRFIPVYAQRKVFEVRNIIDKKFLGTHKAYHRKICHFINVGRLHPQKNQILLVEAFAKMIKRTGDDTATLTIYGQEIECIFNVKEKIEALIRQYHLENRVFLPGWVKDIENKYTLADVFVFGSDYEGLPNALMEAMASGLPCISTNCPSGPSDLITNGENGILIPVGDVDAMSQAMELLVKQPQLAEKMGREARKTMREWGSEEKVAQQLLDNLHRICFG